MMNDESIDSYLHNYPRSHPAHAVMLEFARTLKKFGAKYFYGKLLDIGAGEKRVQILLDDFVQNYIGVDLMVSPHNTSNLDAYATAYSLPFESNAIDSIICSYVIEHLEEPSLAISEAYRVLKPKGYAIYTSPFFWHIHEAPRDFYRYSSHGLRYLFEKNGFEVVQIIPLSGFWTMVLTEFNYYLSLQQARFRRIRIAWLVPILIRISNSLIPLIDRGMLRNEIFTCEYLTIVQKKTSLKEQ